MSKIIYFPKYLWRILVVLVLGLGLGACSGGTTPSGNGNSTTGAAGVSFSMQLDGTRSSGTSASTSKAFSTTKNDSNSGDNVANTTDDGGTPITLSEVRVNIRDVEFYLPPGMRCEDVQFTFVEPVRCDAEDQDEVEEEPGDDNGGVEDGADDSEDGEEGDKVVVEGPFIADLINGTSVPDLSNFLIPSGNYVRIDVRIEEAKAEDGLLTPADPLNGRSLVASGQFEYQGSLHTLNLRLKFNETIRFENPNGIPVSESGANDVVVTLDENSWFTGINLTACLDNGDLTLEADGSLVIDENSGQGECGNIENIIKDNIKASGNVVKDDDDDDDDGIGDAQDNDDDNDGVPDDQEDD